MHTSLEGDSKQQGDKEAQMFLHFSWNYGSIYLQHVENWENKVFGGLLFPV